MKCNQYAITCYKWGANGRGGAITEKSRTLEFHGGLSRVVTLAEHFIYVWENVARMNTGEQVIQMTPRKLYITFNRTLLDKRFFVVLP